MSTDTALSTTFRAMGSQITIWLLPAEPSTANAALQAGAALFAANEQRLSRFQPASELAQLNSRPAEWVPVSDLLWEMIDRALTLQAQTDGLFNPTLLNALEQAGYDRSFEALDRVASLSPATAASTPHPQPIARDPDRRAVYLPPGTRLDLGGIAKGVTAELVVQQLSSVGAALVDAGGDLVAGDAPAGWPGWPVAVAAPASRDEDARDLFRLWLRHATLATSGVDYRRWVNAGQPAHHIIDPRSGRPATSDVVTVSVLANDAATAEGWSTAALILGSTHGVAALTARQLAAAFVLHDGSMRLTPAMQARAQF